jgi:hypothetical protein
MILAGCFFALGFIISGYKRGSGGTSNQEITIGQHLKILNS